MVASACTCGCAIAAAIGAGCMCSRVWRCALPALAVLGVVNAGWDTVLHAATQPGFAAAHGPPPATRRRGERVALIALSLQLAYLVSFSARADAAGSCAIGASAAPGGAGRLSRRPQLVRAERLFRAGGEPRGAACRMSRSAADAAVARPAACASGAGWSARRRPPRLRTDDAAPRRLARRGPARLASFARPRHRRGAARRGPAAARGLGVSAAGGREIVATALFVDLRELHAARRRAAAVRRDLRRQPLHRGDDLGDTRRSRPYHQRRGRRRHERVRPRRRCDDGRPQRACGRRRGHGARIGAVNAELEAEIVSPLRFGVGVHTGPSISARWGHSIGVAAIPRRHRQRRRPAGDLTKDWAALRWFRRRPGRRPVVLPRSRGRRW